MLNQVQHGARPLPGRPACCPKPSLPHGEVRPGGPFPIGTKPVLPGSKPPFEGVRPGGPYPMGAKPSFPHGEVRPGGPHLTDKPLPGFGSELRPIPGKPACPMPKDGFQFSTPGSKGEAEGVGIRNGALKVEGVSEGHAGKKGEGRVSAEEMKNILDGAKNGELPESGGNVFQRAWDWATGN